MEQFAFKILKSKYFICPVMIISLVIACILVYFASIKEKVIFSNAECYQCNYYTDEPNGGNSQVLEHAVSDSVIKFKFQLKDKFHSPYVGLSITPLKKKFINAEKYNQISISILGQNIDRIGISLFTPPLNSGENSYQDETLYHSYLNITSQQKLYNLPVLQFQHPEWWEDLHHIPETSKNKPDLDKILHLNIGSAFSPDNDKEKTLEIYSIAFTRNNQKLFLTIGFIYFGFVFLNFGILCLIASRKNKSSEIIVSYKSLEITDEFSGEEKCIEYINSNYNISTLTLKNISEETAIAQRRITKIIHDRFNCNFKTYLNRIRINESKRLLTQSSLNIGEIAYKVGFNSQSHFNRVFKSEIQISPSEYRESHKS